MKEGALMQNGKMLVILDFDYVIAQPLGFVAFAMRLLFLMHLNPEKLLAGLERCKFILPKFWRQNFSKFIESFHLLIPIEGAIEHLLELKRDGYEFIIVTSRTGFLLNLAIRWLEKNKLGFIEVISAKNKPEVVSSLGGVDVVIDDNHRFIMSITGRNIRCIVFSQPHNKAKPLSVESMGSWADLGPSLRR